MLQSQLNYCAMSNINALALTEENGINSQSSLIELWLSRYGINTSSLYKVAIAQFFKITNLASPNNLEFKHITLFEAHLRSRGYEESSIATKINAVKSFVKWLSLNGGITNQTAVQIGQFKTKNQLSPITERLISEQEVELLLNAIANPRDYLAVVSLISLGLRVSELCSLKWENLRNETLSVKGKGGKTRYLVVPSWLIEEWRNLSLNYGGKKQTGLIFRRKDGNAMSRFTVWEIIKHAAAKAGITDKVSPHWLRHYHAVSSLKNGCRLDILQATLGHSSLNTTQKYLHVLPTESSTNYIKIPVKAT